MSVQSLRDLSGAASGSVVAAQAERAVRGGVQLAPTPGIREVPELGGCQLRKPRHVLVLPGGTEIGLEINRALSQCKEVRLFSGGTECSNHAPYVFARHFALPSVHCPGWLEALDHL